MATGIISHNFQIVSNRSHGEWLEADGLGKLYSVKGFVSKFWFIIRNIFTCGGLRARTAKAITEVCKKFFDEVVANCPSPLDSNAAALQKYKGSIQKMAGSVQRMKARICDQKLAQKIRELNRCPEFVEAVLAIEQGKLPSVLDAGVNGTYILYNRKNKPWGIFKPKEEEVGCAGNPKGYNKPHDLNRKLKIEPGASYLREAAAYLLDHDHFAGVPVTVVAKLPSSIVVIGEGEGSFQKFIPGCKNAYAHYQILPRFLSRADGHKIPAHEIHKIAIFDLRTLNCDRHLFNFLVDKEWHIYPIDHGYILPGNATGIRFNWMNFNQAKVPFSKEDLEYIERLDPKADAELLKKHFPSLSPEVLSRMEVAGLLMKKAAKKGLTAYQIGELMTGQDPDPLGKWIHHFMPLPLHHPSHFESVIMKRATHKGNDLDRVLESEIARYLGAKTGSQSSSQLHSG